MGRPALVLIFLTSLGFSEPPAAQLLFRNIREIGFDVEDRRAVEHVDAAHAKFVAVAGEQLDDGKRDGIRAARGAGGEDTVGTIVAGRLADQVESF